jgi:anaphase-promoting complex subunit 1
MDRASLRVQVQLWPKHDFSSKVLRLCRFALPVALGDRLLAIWWNRNRAYQFHPEKEWHALAVSLLSIVLALEPDGRGKKTTRKQRTSSIAHAPTPSPTLFSTIDSFDAKSSFNTQSTSPWSWAVQCRPSASPTSPRQRRLERNSSSRIRSQTAGKFIYGHVAATREFVASADGSQLLDMVRNQRGSVHGSLPKLLFSLHLFREDLKLSSLASAGSATGDSLGPILAQIGRWLGLNGWTWKKGDIYHLELAPTCYVFEDSKSYPALVKSSIPRFLLVSATVVADDHSPAYLHSPPSLQRHLESYAAVKQLSEYPLLGETKSRELSITPSQIAAHFTPRTLAFTKVMDAQKSLNGEPHASVEAILASGVHLRMLETFPEALNCMLKEWIVQCQANPPTTWPNSLLTYVSRDDLKLLTDPRALSLSDSGYFKVTVLDSAT